MGGRMRGRISYMLHFSIYVFIRINKDYHCYMFQGNQIKAAFETDFPDNKAKAMPSLDQRIGSDAAETLQMVLVRLSRAIISDPKSRNSGVYPKEIHSLQYQITTNSNWIVLVTFVQPRLQLVLDILSGTYPRRRTITFADLWSPTL